MKKGKGHRFAQGEGEGEGEGEGDKFGVWSLEFGVEEFRFIQLVRVPNKVRRIEKKFLTVHLSSICSDPFAIFISW